MTGAGSVFGGRRIEVPKELEPFWELSALSDTSVFAMLPYHLEIH